ncbi:unnamed protein product (macronuclear) [Paramecium tetraurelia]|uniref:Uncharacterized protein n=1 Tax=Paramecium tetraurelia TaxID=5888 RepID=A0BM62_PARTE|nr:uncharacterized protein GSPATT00030263001 [Paramecium tetraurelia]CAK59629.1 unnamed protein product [Paramecium tetraurelia]|eukprot:XP_001427027.1 hypothetical protein (macronuclear) [Paramecium tetraurelia strain d4-2]
MFNIVGELWKAQQYAKNECCFEVPQTFYLQGSKISHYFTSSQCSGKILKKRKENVTLKSILDTFNSKEKYVCSFQRLLNKKDVQFKYLTRIELEALISDITNFSELYQDVIIQQTFQNENIIAYCRHGHITQIQQRIPLQSEPLITLKDSQFACEKVIFEARVNKVGLAIEQFISLIEGSKVNEIELYMKYVGEKLIVMWNTNLKCRTNRRALNFINSQNYLHNQEYFEQFQPKKQVTDEITMIQCCSCRKLTKINDTFEVLKNRIWKIRMHRNLHHLNDQKLYLDVTGRIVPKFDEFQFVRVCGICYNSFIETISNNNTKTENTLRKLPQKQQDLQQLMMQNGPRRKLFKLNDNQTYLGSRSNSTQIKEKRMTPQIMNSTFDENYESIQNQRMEIDDDFDQLLNEVKNEVRSSYQSNKVVTNKARIQSAQNNQKFKLYYQ